MPIPESNRAISTADQILDIAENLVQTRGYSAFSYQDIALLLAIRKASIHYHFASKAELIIAVVDRYAKRFTQALTQIGSDPNKSSLQMLDLYFGAYMQFARTPDKVCLCGALAGEMMALPPEVRKRVDTFFKAHQVWLSGVLKTGEERGEITLTAPPAKMARLIFGALQGALLVKRTTGDQAQLSDVVRVIRGQLSATRAPSLPRIRT